MSNLAQRVLTAAIALPAAVALVLWQVHLGFFMLTLAVAVVGLVEFGHIGLRGRPAFERGLVVVAGSLLALLLYHHPASAFVWVLATVMVVAVGFLVRPGEIETVTARLGIGVFGALYLGALPVTLALLQRDVADGPHWVLLALGVTFACDTAAYFGGRALGRHKLYPLVSPGKTVEGAVAGIAGAVGFAFAARATFMPELSVVDIMAVGVPAAVLAPLGDLVESLLKRSAGVKDSGTVFPGHGGVLDRVDALLFVAPWVYVYAMALR